MRLSDGRHFSYCLNVHPGEALADVRRALCEDVPAVGAALSPEAPFGVGLRLAAKAVTALKKEEALRAFRCDLDARGLYAFTVNAFPYGAFHRARVKENVYLPDWSHPDRAAYTLDTARILAQLVPEGEQGSVSTVPLGYRFRRGWTPDACIPPLLEVAEGLRRLEAETGTLVHLGLEPEPDCWLETTNQTVAFFEDLFRAPGAEEETLRRYLGVCVDTCHVAMQFEDPAETLRRLGKAGIRVSKLQLSAALEVEAANVAPGRLQAFDDGVYLHQTAASSGLRRRDLPEWLAQPDPDAGTLRIHAHVPLHWDGEGGLGTTRHTLTDAFWREAARSGCPHLEVETYTFDVLPPEITGERTVAENMIEECTWALKHLESSSTT